MEPKAINRFTIFKIATSGSVVECVAIETAVCNHAVDVGAERDLADERIGVP